jgi:hypothetical protein
MDRLSKLRLCKALPFLAVADIFEDLIAFDKKELLVPQFQIKAIAEAGYSPTEPATTSHRDCVFRTDNTPARPLLRRRESRNLSSPQDFSLKPP